MSIHITQSKIRIFCYFIFVIHQSYETLVIILSVNETWEREREREREREWLKWVEIYMQLCRQTIFFSLCNIDKMVYLNHKIIVLAYAYCIVKSQESGICSISSEG